MNILHSTKLLDIETYLTNVLDCTITFHPGDKLITIEHDTLICGVDVSTVTIMHRGLAYAMDRAYTKADKAKHCIGECVEGNDILTLLAILTTDSEVMQEEEIDCELEHDLAWERQQQATGRIY